MNLDYTYNTYSRQLLCQLSRANARHSGVGAWLGIGTSSAAAWSTNQISSPTGRILGRGVTRCSLARMARRMAASPGGPSPAPRARRAAVDRRVGRGDAGLGGAHARPPPPSAAPPSALVLPGSRRGRRHAGAKAEQGHHRTAGASIENLSRHRVCWIRLYRMAASCGPRCRPGREVTNRAPAFFASTPRAPCDSCCRDGHRERSAAAPVPEHALPGETAAERGLR